MTMNEVVGVIFGFLMLLVGVVFLMFILFSPGYNKIYSDTDIEEEVRVEVPKAYCKVMLRDSSGRVTNNYYESDYKEPKLLTFSPEYEVMEILFYADDIGQELEG